ncbi:hypothetical protein [Myxococcus xanthus]|uniref:hypothetical protein n=1 Tax=Myxococcus xanthus TaxID=34 RepID=UPI0011280537|nr:hypothetical protein [Myxococcus xanthus]QDF05046.1 hypothetical protein BHS04_17810 [Myxococcus xanthus]
MLVASKLKLQDGLPPVTLSTDKGPVTVPCVFRERGVVIARLDFESGTEFSVSHEPSGDKFAPYLRNGAHALALAAGLLHLPVDWSQDADAVKAQIRGLSEAQRGLLACIGAGRLLFTPMGVA